MLESKEYRKIKKLYGERFAKLCRELFPLILEGEGILTGILEKNFAKNSHSLGEDIIESNSVEEFKQIIFEEYDKIRENKDEKKDNKGKRTPYEILDSIGYDLYECQTEADIQNFAKYYARGGDLGTKGEILCTIYLGGRLNSRYCFWAIKKDVDEIKRNDFKNPNKSDEYSLSVLAIQFDKKTGEVQIISRYNHTVPNPNCTLGNSLDNLAPGLEQSFSDLLEQRGLELNSPKGQKMELPGYTIANDGKYYKYNYEIDGKYYCPGNIIIEGGEARTISSPEKGMLIDYFYIDLENKTINVCDGIKDSFTKDLQDIERIEVVKSEDNKEEKIIKIFKSKVEEPIIIGINKYNQIIRYENINLKQVRDNFLVYNESITNLKLPSLERAGNNFLRFNIGLTSLGLTSLEQTGDNFLLHNIDLTSLELPNLKLVGSKFLYRNIGLISLDLPKLERVGNGFLYRNTNLTSLNLPKLEQVGNKFLYRNTGLTSLDLPNLKQVGNEYLHYNTDLINLNLPKLEQTGDKFLLYNRGLTSLKLSSLKQVGDYFLGYNENLADLDLPSLKQVGNYFLGYNEGLTNLDLPKLKQAGNGFLYSNTALASLKLLNLEQVGDYFLHCNRYKKVLTNVKLQKWAMEKYRYLLPDSLITKAIEQSKGCVPRSEINKVANRLIETELEMENEKDNNKDISDEQYK